MFGCVTIQITCMCVIWCTSRLCGDADHFSTWVIEWILPYVAFCTIMAISQRKKARSRDSYFVLILRMTSRVFYSAQYHRQHSTLKDFEQLGYTHNHNEKYPARQRLELGTFRLHAPVDTNEPSGPPYYLCLPSVHRCGDILLYPCPLSLSQSMLWVSHSFLSSDFYRAGVKPETLTQCWANFGPPSTTLTQH